MKATDNLYQLVKSLTGMEKRYFKVFAKRHVSGESTKYEVLFDLYDAQPDDVEYDEAKFKNGLKAKGIGKNLPDEKKNLQEMIMKAMRAYHSETTVDHQLSDLLADEIFYKKKRLNDLRRKTIDKGKQIAEKYGRHNTLLALKEREVMMRIELDQDHLAYIAATVELEQQALTDKITTISRLWAISNWFFIKYRTGANKTVEFWEEAAERMADPVFAGYKPGLSYRADLYYYKIRSIYAILKEDAVANNLNQQLVYDLYERKYPEQQIDNKIGYKIALYNHMHSLIAVKEYARVEELLGHAASIKADDEDEAGEDFQNVVFYRMQLYNYSGEFEKVVAMIPEIKKGLKQYKKKINKARELSIYGSIATAYMMIGRWAEVIEYTEMIIMDKSEARMDVKYSCMMRQLVAYYESGNYDILIYQLRNVERLLKKRGVCGDGETFFFKVLSQLLKQGKEYLKKNEKQIEANLPMLDSDREIRIWLQSRLTGKSMREVFAEIF